MKWLKGFINLVFIAVLGGVIVFVLQDHYATLKRTEGLSAVAITGPWVSLDADKNNRIDLTKQMSFLDDPNSLARIVISNKGATTVEKVRIKFESDFPPESMLIDASKKQGIYLGKVADADLPTLDPGDSTTIFLWTPSGFGWPSFFGDVKIYTSLGEVPISYTTHVTEYGYGDGDGDTSFLGFLSRYWYWIVGILGASMFGLSIWADVFWKKYISKLILDDDFWLSERAKMEKVGRDKFKPDVSDLSISTDVSIPATR